MSDPTPLAQREADVTRAFLITRLFEIQEQLCRLTLLCGEGDYRKQFHPDLSPVGWHLGHTMFIEDLWIRKTLLGEDGAAGDARGLYLPQNARKPTRGMQLPPLDELINDCRRAQGDNRALLDNPPASVAAHRLMQDDYLLKFLTQHHAMHLETVYMALTEKNLQKQEADCYFPQQQLEPADVCLKPVAFDGGEFEIGGMGNWCFDNELPRHREILQDFALNATAATNAEFLGFIKNGGYDNAAWWDDAGRQWLGETGARAPHHWRCDEDNAWYSVNDDGCCDLAANAPVHGLSRHEARAFACYAGARLPHESEWEAAHAQNPVHQRIQTNDHAWEWCGNPFRPYPGFKPFPYDEYSTPWFHGTHYVLRGHSRHTPDVLHRPTFRNFHVAEKRYIFAGVRVAMT